MQARHLRPARHRFEGAVDIGGQGASAAALDECADAGKELLQLAARRAPGFGEPDEGVAPLQQSLGEGDRKSGVEGKMWSVRVDRGGRRIIKKKNKKKSYRL